MSSSCFSTILDIIKRKINLFLYQNNSTATNFVCINELNIGNYEIKSIYKSIKITHDAISPLYMIDINKKLRELQEGKKIPSDVNAYRILKTNYKYSDASISVIELLEVYTKKSEH